jgi:hypothetical protein
LHFSFFQNNDRLPQSPQEKKHFQESIKALSRSFQNEINFQEAHKEFFSAYKRPFPSEELQTLIEQQKNKPLNKEDDDFSFLLRALDLFLQENNNFVPLNGFLPDMTSTTDWYVQLQSIFHNKASQDRAWFRSLLFRELEVSCCPSNSFYFLSLVFFSPSSLLLVLLRSSIRKRENQTRESVTKISRSFARTVRQWLKWKPVPFDRN